MDDDKINTPKTGGAKAPAGKSRKRPAPTIDLKASNVTDTPVKDSVAEPVAPVSDEPVSATSDTREIPNPFENKPSDDKSAKNVSPEYKPAHENTASDAKPAFASSRAATFLVAGLIGAMTAALVVAASWFMAGPGGFSNISKLQGTAKADMETLNSRVAKIESRPAQSATASVAAPAVSSAPDPALIARLDTLEKSIASLRDDIGSTRTTIEAIKSAPREVVTPPDLKPVEDRIAKIEQATAALTTEMAAPAKQAAEDPRIRIAAVAASLDTSVRAGEPYVATLANVRSLVGETSALKPLDGFADKGIPTASALNKELLTLLSQLSPKPATAAAPSTIMERLQQGASRLVQVKRTDQAVNENANTVARITAAAQRDDLAAARRELNTLPAADQTTLQSWRDKVDARETALAASRQFVSDMTSALSKPAAR